MYEAYSIKKKKIQEANFRKETEILKLLPFNRIKVARMGSRVHSYRWLIRSGAAQIFQKAEQTYCDVLYGVVLHALIGKLLKKRTD